MAQPHVMSRGMRGQQDRSNARIRLAKGSGKPWDAIDELVKDGVIGPEQADSLRRASERTGVPTQEIALQRHMASAKEIATAEAAVLGVQLADLSAFPPDPALLDAFGCHRALRAGCLPWHRIGRKTLVVARSQQAFAAALPALAAALPNPVLAIATKDDIAHAIMRQRRGTLARAAETLVSRDESCRTLSVPNWPKFTLLVGAALLFALCFAPGALFATLTLWAVLTLAATASLKAAAAIAVLMDPGPSDALSAIPPPGEGRAISTRQLPTISVMVALYKETEIAQHLVARLQRLNYPREKLDIILVTESEDITTQDTLARTTLPHWMRQVTVPPGKVKTKPRALNFALDHCRGAIIGVYDAEDAPEPDQLLTVAAHFARAPPEVACLQGRLDFYNPRQNWLSRCFAMEYAAWFRVVLPGLAKLGLPVPLGGTTLFFRRSALDALHGWDAHNVTEDADLGLRLARHGYRTELVDTVTYEEANCHAWPWVRQRSRWIKGYAITYAVHMRRPLKLLFDLGLWGFLGVQVLFACSLSQFLMAPVLWSYWPILFGYDHPVLSTMSEITLTALIAFFLVTEVIGLAVVVLGISKTHHKGLVPWTPTLMGYFYLGTAAAYKALLELFWRPFYWDKTSHGITLSQDQNGIDAPDHRARGGGLLAPMSVPTAAAEAKAARAKAQTPNATPPLRASDG